MEIHSGERGGGGEREREREGERERGGGGGGEGEGEREIVTGAAKIEKTQVLLLELGVEVLQS